MGRREWDHESGGGIFWGITLIVAGVIFLLEFSGVLSWFAWASWWPLFMVVMGISQIATARSPRRIGSGVTLSLLGGWCFVAINDWHGLRWDRSWPLALVAVGCGMVTRAIAARVMHRDRPEEIKFDATH